ncbi:hypothetical protein SAMN05444161_7303 [Rhizobiales bacterium GAS191]|nr:hypothetical protein SAMN05444161_7303 [Rhizobiales bacterium GAS191]
MKWSGPWTSGKAWGNYERGSARPETGPNRRHLGSASEGAQRTLVKATGLTPDELRQVERTVTMVRDNLISHARAAKDQRVHQQ